MIRETYHHHNTLRATVPAAMDLTKDVPHSSLEMQITGRAEATISDNAEVDLSLWALKGETPQQAQARVLLRRLVVKWWANNLEKEAKAWLKANGNSAKDREAIEDCIRCAKACRYLQWIQVAGCSFGGSQRSFAMTCGMGSSSFT